MTPGRDRGVVLVNVLVIIAISATLVLALAGRQDAALQRARSGAAAAQARALLDAAETSVLVALERDLRDAPDTDHFAEPWAAVLQEEAELASGRFSVGIEDLRGKFDLNRLTEPTLQDTSTFRALIGLLDLPAVAANEILAALDGADRLADTAALRNLGVAAAVIDRIAPHVAALPLPDQVNLNTADEILLAAMLGNTIDARRLVQLRARQGFVTQEDLARLRIVIPPNAGFRSDLFDMTARAEVDGAAAAMTSRIQRVSSNERTLVHVIRRRMGHAALPAVPDTRALFAD